MSSFDLRRLRYFLTVAELGSVTRAARELHVAQPALSHQIRLLEDEIGEQLFARGPQGVRLTGLGENLAREARTLLGDVRALRDRLRDRASDPQGSVTVGLAQTIGPVIAVPLLELAVERLPRVHIQIRELMSSDIPDLVRSESIDFAFSYAIPSGHGIRTANLFSEDLFLVATTECSAKYFRKAKPGKVDFAQLEGVPLYLSARSNGFRDYLERVARDQGVSLRVAAEVDSVAVRKEIALSGAGFTILSGATIRREIERDEIFAARIARPSVRRKISFVTRSGSALPRAAQAVAALVAESLTTFIGRGLWPGAVLPAAGIPRFV